MAVAEVWWAGPVAPESSLDLLDDVERVRHGRYVRAEDRARFRTARVLAKTVLARRLGTSPAEIRFDASCRCGQPHGKPRLAGSGLELSISHSGDRIAVAVCDAPVGVDVEQMPTRPVSDGLLAAALSGPELSVVNALPATERPTAFLAYWTRKEALLKATGEGLATPMDSITLTGPDEPPGVLDPGKSTVDPAVLGMADLRPGDGYRAAVAVLTAQPLTVTEHEASGLGA